MLCELLGLTVSKGEYIIKHCSFWFMSLNLITVAILFKLIKSDLLGALIHRSHVVVVVVVVDVDATASHTVLIQSSCYS